MTVAPKETAAIGTSISYIVGDGILLNIYLHRTIKLEVFTMFKRIFSGLGWSIVISLLLGIPLIFWPSSLGWFFAKVIIYSIIYSIVIYFVGMNEYEKRVIKKFMRRGDSVVDR